MIAKIRGAEEEGRRGLKKKCEHTLLLLFFIKSKNVKGIAKQKSNINRKMVAGDINLL